MLWDESAISIHYHYFSGYILPGKANTITAWCDGSFAPHARGAGAYIIAGSNQELEDVELQTQSTLTFDNPTSSYETELVTLKATTSYYLDRQHLNRRNIHIFTDSLSCLAQLNSLATKPKLVHVIIDELSDHLANLRANSNNIDFHFIPSHVGISSNDDVDKLANDARENGADEHLEHRPLLSSYKLHIRKAHKEISPLK